MCLTYLPIPPAIGVLPDITYTAVDDTIHVDTTPGSDPITLTIIANDIHVPTSALNETSSGVWLLNATLKCKYADGVIIINSSDCTRLDIKSYPANGRAIIWNGNITFTNVTVRGVNASNTLDETPHPTRSFIATTNETAASGSFLAYDTTFQCLGNSTASTNRTRIFGLRYSQGIHLRKPYPAAKVEFYNCTFDQLSCVWIWGHNQLNLTKSRFINSDCLISLFLQWQQNQVITELTFINASEFLFNDLTNVTLQDITMQDQWTNDSRIAGMSRAENLILSNWTITDCANNTVRLEWANVNVTFQDWFMNNTGIQKQTGIYVNNCTRLKIEDSTFISMNRINAHYADFCEFDNLTIIGNFGEKWQFGILGGDHAYVHDCRIYNISGNGISLIGNSIAENNYLEECGSGISVHGGNIWTWRPADNITIRDNTILNMSYSVDAWSCGIRIGGGENGTAKDILVENNTIQGGNAGILLYRGVHDAVIKDNNITIMPWGTGGAYLPIGYTRPVNVSGWRNPSDYRVIAGIFIARQWGVSWNWTRYGPISTFENITLSNNDYNGTYMQAYVWIDKTEQLGDNTITGSVDTGGFSGDYFKFEFTEDYYNGSIVYANSANPIYRYRRNNGSCWWGAGPQGGALCNTTWYFSLNSTHWGARKPIANYSGPATSHFWWYWSSLNASVRQLVPNDNITRWLELYNVSATEKSCVNYTAGSLPTIEFNSTALSNTNNEWRVYSEVFGEPTHVYINNVENTANWTFTEATNITIITWKHASPVYVNITFPPLAPYPPTADDVVITDMEGCGNWLFSEEKYYTFMAQYSDPNGYADLDTMMINFTDGAATIVTSYDGTYWRLSNLDADHPEARIKTGTRNVIDAETLNISFPIYLTDYILDAWNISIYGWCNDTAGLTSNWTLLASNYFHILNEGGLSRLTTSNSTLAGRITGGDVFDLYVRNGSVTVWVEASTIFRNLQHVKMLPRITSIAANSMWNISYFIDYCTDQDDWITGYGMTLQQLTVVANGSRYALFRMFKYNQGNLIGTTHIWVHHTAAATDTNTTTQLWIDLWFNKINASSTAGARVNAYYFPMKDNSNTWLRWLTGNNWGIDVDRRKSEMFFPPLLDLNATSISTKLIKLVRVRCRLEVPGGFTQNVTVSNYDVFDLTFGSSPMVGVQTPPFDETLVPAMPQGGGFLGVLWSGIQWLGKKMGEWAGPHLMNFWMTFVGFLDTVFGWLGFPNLATNLISWTTSLFAWLGTSFESLITMLIPTFLMLGTFLPKFTNTLATAFGVFADYFTNTWYILDSSWGMGASLWDSLQLSTWLMLGLILYPIYLLILWDQKGLDAAIGHVTMVMNMLAFIAKIFITVIQWTLALIGRIIESIPIVE